ncbi:hypothetical protein GH140_06150, partial [bacterium]|nr:hypothetical protein [bacterium]
MIRKNLIIAILCLFFFQVLFAQMPGEISYKDESVMPAGKKGERIRSLIATVNSNDPAQIRRFVEDALTEEFQKIAPMEEHIAVVLDFLRETGGVDFHSIRTYVPEPRLSFVSMLLGTWKRLLASPQAYSRRTLSPLAMSKVPENTSFSHNRGSRS